MLRIDRLLVESAWSKT